VAEVDVAQLAERRERIASDARLGKAQTPSVSGTSAGGLVVPETAVQVELLQVRERGDDSAARSGTNAAVRPLIASKRMEGPALRQNIEDPTVRPIVSRNRRGVKRGEANRSSP